MTTPTRDGLAAVRRLCSCCDLSTQHKLHSRNALALAAKHLRVGARTSKFDACVAPRSRLDIPRCGRAPEPLASSAMCRSESALGQSSVGSISRQLNEEPLQKKVSLRSNASTARIKSSPARSLATKPCTLAFFASVTNCSPICIVKNRMGISGS